MWSLEYFTYDVINFLFQVRDIIKSYRWAPFIPVAPESSMLSVLLLLSKFRLRNVPVIEPGKPDIQNFITQSAVVQGLEGCKGRDWFDCITALPISDLGLPFRSYDEVSFANHLHSTHFPGPQLNFLANIKSCQVISIQSDELVLEAFKQMRDNKIGGLPVVKGPKKKIVGNVSIRDIRYLLLKPELFSNFR